MHSLSVTGWMGGGGGGVSDETCRIYCSRVDTPPTSDTRHSDVKQFVKSCLKVLLNVGDESVQTAFTLPLYATQSLLIGRLLILLPRAYHI